MIRIYGFGNALIDVEITVSDKELASVGIAKGSMVHIGYNQKNLWLKQFRRKIASRQPGGSIANSIYAASNEDTFCSFSCSLGKDEEGKKFINGFNSNNTKVFSKQSQKPTGTCFIFTTPDGERTMASNLSANEDLLPECLNTPLLEKSNWLIFDAFSVCTTNGFETAKEALKIAKKNQLKIGFGLADINLVNFNLGSRGARYNEMRFSAHNVSVVNTNGAGDALLGVFLSSLDRLGPQESLKSAVKYATEVCLAGGPRI